MILNMNKRKLRVLCNELPFFEILLVVVADK
jgi:hypothetical protein